jgi:hypothetical protein
MKAECATRIAPPRLRHRGLTPEEWLRLHGSLPGALPEALAHDHAQLSRLVAPAAAALELLRWSCVGVDRGELAHDLSTVAELADALRDVGVAV